MKCRKDFYKGKNNVTQSKSECSKEEIVDRFFISLFNSRLLILNEAVPHLIMFTPSAVKNS